MDMKDPNPIDPDTARLLEAQHTRWTEHYRAKEQMRRIVESASQRRWERKMRQLTPEAADLLKQLRSLESTEHDEHEQGELRAELRAWVKSKAAAITPEPSPELQPIFNEIPPHPFQNTPPIATLNAYYAEEYQLFPVHVIQRSFAQPPPPFRDHLDVSIRDPGYFFVETRTVVVSWLFNFVPPDDRIYHFFPTGMGYGYCLAYAAPHFDTQPPYDSSWAWAQATFNGSLWSSLGVSPGSTASVMLADAPGRNGNYGDYFWFGRPGDGLDFVPSTQVHVRSRLLANSRTIVTATYILTVARRGNAYAHCDFEGSTQLGQQLELGPVRCYVY